jgi:phage FluMu protein Com
MQIRCNNCHKPFAMNKDAVVAALETVHSENMGHYNAQCPHCRRVNRVSKEELLRAAPDWENQGESEGSRDDTTDG